MLWLLLLFQLHRPLDAWNMNCGRVGGFARGPFAELKDIFRENFAHGLESAGAAFALYYNDELVADLYGGCADREQNIPWKQDTLAVMFSITKEMSAIGLAMLIDEGQASYDDLVSKWWPAFAQNGKGNVTIRQIVNHEAGLVYGDNIIFTPEDVENPERMSAIFEQMPPLWMPGKYCGYHTLTFGFLIDQLVRRIDRKGRGVAQYVTDEIIRKYEIPDISIGLKQDEDNERVATIYEKTDEELEMEGRRNPEALRKYQLADNKHIVAVYENWPWVLIPDYNRIEVRRLPMPSNMGISTARALAAFHYLLAKGKLLSKKFIEANLLKPQLEEAMDLTNWYPESKGLGWQFYNNRAKNRLYNRNKNHPLWNIGHSGYGGQNVRVDFRSGLSMAYLCNGLKAADAEDVDSFRRLQDKTYEILRNLR